MYDYKYTSYSRDQKPTYISEEDFPNNEKFTHVNYSIGKWH